MKNVFGPLLFSAVSLSMLLGFRAAADLEVSASVTIHSVADFHAPLASHGTWVEVGSYERCWQPASVAVEWRPYCDGTWVWTDCGWYWSSREPWAWAFVFVEARRLHEPVRPKTVIVDNTVIVNKTTIINNLSRETRALGGSAPQQVVVNPGPGVEPVQQATGKKINAVPIRQVASQTPVPAGLRRKTSEPPGQEPTPGRQQSKQPAESAPTPAPPTAPNPKPVPPDKPQRSEPPTAPDQSTPPAKPPPGPPNPLPQHDVVPPPRTPEAPSGKPNQRPTKQREGKVQPQEQKPGRDNPARNDPN